MEHLLQYVLSLCNNSKVIEYFIFSAAATIAMIFGILAWILSYLVPSAIVDSYENLSWTKKILFGLFPNMALDYGYNTMFLFETKGKYHLLYNLHCRLTVHCFRSGIKLEEHL